MKRILLATVIFLMAVTVASAAWTVVPSKYSEYQDGYGKHFVLKLVCTSDGSAGSYALSQANISRDFYDAVFDKFLLTMDGDPVGTVTAEPTITITGANGATVWYDSTTFEITDTKRAACGDYNGYPPHMIDTWTMAFSSSLANGEQYIFYLDFVR